MQSPTVEVPSSLLMDPHLSVSAKLVWMLHAAREAVSTRRICPGPESGLSRPTTRRAIRELVAAGWLDAGLQTLHPAPAGGPGPDMSRALVPVTLLLDRRLGAQERVLYCVLRILPSFCGSSQVGTFTFSGLHRITGAAVSTLRITVRELSNYGWLGAEHLRRLDPIRYELGNPVLAEARLWAERAGRRVQCARHKGETIMREFLTLLINSKNFQDNAMLGFLENPMSGEPMQFDRYYPDDVAFEFNGPHHDGPTDTVSARESAKQQSRDLIKKQICSQKGIRLFVLRRSDLTYETMRQIAVSTGLPLRDQIGLEPVIRTLNAISREHRKK